MAVIPVSKINWRIIDVALSAAHFWRKYEICQGNNFYICIGPDSEDQAKKIFSALAEGGKIGQPLQMQVWGDLYGDLTDKFGIKWMVNYNPKQGQS